jgi:hypothetical protein
MDKPKGRIKRVREARDVALAEYKRAMDDDDMRDLSLLDTLEMRIVALDSLLAGLLVRHSTGGIS